VGVTLHTTNQRKKMYHSKNKKMKKGKKAKKAKKTKKK
jgi:hypothetical protein